MKRFMPFLLAVVCTVVIVGGAFAVDPCASGGRLVVPEIIAAYKVNGETSYSHLTLTNVSGTDIQCSVTVYDDNGTEVSGISTVYHGNATSPEPVIVQDGNATFPMPVGTTRCVKMEAYPEQKNITGYAIIEWRCDDPKVTKALVGSSMYAIRHESLGVAKAYLNNGQPF